MKQNLTQDKLSELSGISLRTLQRIEKNEGSLKIPFIK
ncbi:helix-turn-helix domain-containing protein [Cyclobacterium amurskyense]